MSSRHHVAAILVILMTVVVLVTDAAAQLTASWIDNSNGSAAFSIERRLSTDTTYASLANVPTGVTTYVDPGAAQGVTYCYRVMAYDAYGTSGYSNEACGAVAVAAVSPTPTPTPTPPPPTSSSYTITITKSGSGDGMVTSNPTGISCGSGCAVSYPAATLVTLTAAAASGSRFVGWSGGCSGTGPCTIVGNSSLTVGATFNVLSRGQLKRAQR
jgi:Divergent InlB B-repeat domain